MNLSTNRGLRAAVSHWSRQPQPVKLTFWLNNSRAVYGAAARFRSEADRKIDTLIRINDRSKA